MGLLVHECAHAQHSRWNKPERRQTINSSSPPHPEIQLAKLPEIGVDWLSQQSSSFMAVCHRVSVDEPGLFGVDTERGVLGEQSAGRWHPITTRREVGARGVC